MGSCHINFMYVNSGIDKSLDVSISLTKQIPHKVQTEGLLCSYYPSGTAADISKWEFLAKFYATGYGSQ